MLSETEGPWLLMPGPLSTSLSIKQAMMHNWGSRDAALPFGEGVPSHQRRVGHKS